jgi:hypothetical protein
MHSYLIIVYIHTSGSESGVEICISVQGKFSAIGPIGLLGTGMGKIRNARGILAGKPEKKRPL